ncbi:MAG: ABC transporter C-terminal domain-containing protein [Rhodocyclaceae bacterium]
MEREREPEALPAGIGGLENEQQGLAQHLSDPALYGDPQQAQAIAARLAAIDDELHALLERWESLETRLK